MRASWLRLGEWVREVASMKGMGSQHSPRGVRVRVGDGVLHGGSQRSLHGKAHISPLWHWQRVAGFLAFVFELC